MLVDVKNLDHIIDQRIKNRGYSKCLYHYTSIPVLDSIISTQKIWFGNTAVMNDKKEIKYFVEKIKRELQNELCEQSPNAISQIHDYFEKVDERINDEYPYAMCFTKLEDDAAQWERYADNAKGVCIVFNTKNIMKAFYDPYLLFNEVYYDTDIKEHEHYKRMLKHFKDVIEKGIEQEYGLLDNMIACGYAQKHRSFRSEQEIRVINLWNHIPDGAIVETECVSGLIKKFMKFNVKQRCDSVGLSFEDLFDGIIIGPKSEQNIDVLQKYFKDKGMNKLQDKIIKSDCPLR